MTVLMDRPVAGVVRKNLALCVVDDESDQAKHATLGLEKAGFSAIDTIDPEEALQKIRHGSCRVVLVDLQMPRMDGLTFLEKALQCDPGTHVILITGDYSVDSAIEAIKRGAYDYLRKPLDYTRLLKTLDDPTELFARRSQISDLEAKLLYNLEFHGIVGRSPKMLDVLELVQKIARHYTNVLVTGPIGSGKALVARALHQMSPVGQERFATCNCSALADTLLESQLFGHVCGAFGSAADASRPV